jgi:hypothetical protein
MKPWTVTLLAACLILPLAPSAANAAATNQMQVTATVLPSGSLLSCDEARHATRAFSQSCGAALTAATGRSSSIQIDTAAPKVKIENAGQAVTVTLEY